MDDSIPDDRLKLMFTCCHPALALEAQVALTLHTLGGLSTQEVARAFLVPVPTMAQRLARARTQNPRRRHPLSRAARRSAARTAGRAAGGHLPDLQRGVLRPRMRRYAHPARTVRGSDPPGPRAGRAAARATQRRGARPAGADAAARFAARDAARRGGRARPARRTGSQPAGIRQKSARGLRFWTRRSP